MKNSLVKALRTSTAPIACGLVLLGSAAHAQETNTDTDDSSTIVVTGTRLGAQVSSASPVTVISQEEIKLQGTTRVEDILNSLPSVFASQASTLSNGADGTASVDLRGLGTSRTLTLVNGRRLVPGDPSPSSGSGADINIIPAALLKRVDVLTGGASSVYGADAVAGVVNFVIDKDFTGLRLDGQYSFYQHNNNDKFLPQYLDARGFDYPRGSTTDGGTVDVTAAFGADLDDGRGHVMGYAGYRKINPITQNSRDYSSCTLQNGGTGTPRCGGSATSDNGNVFLFDEQVAPGTSTAYTFTPGGGFENTATLYNFAPLNYFQRPDERYTAGVFANYEINKSIRPYLEFMFMDDKTVAQIAPSGDFGNTLTVNCDNPLMSDAQRAVVCDSDNLINGFLGTFPLATAAPYNDPDLGGVPAGTPPIGFVDSQGTVYNQGFFQLLRRNVEGGPRRSELKHTTYRAVFGVEGDFADVWSYDAYYQYARNNYSQVYSNEFSVARLNRALNVITDNRTGSATFGQPVCRSVIDGSDPTCVPYNVFAGAGGASQESVQYLSATGFQSGSTSEQVINGSVTGDLTTYGVATPWANDGLTVNFGVEYRKESLELQTDNAFSTGDLTGQGGATLPLSGSFDVLEFFAEGQLPLVQDSFIYDASLTAGYRRSHYETSAGNTYNTDTFKIGAEVAPTADIRLRAMYNRAVRAPNIQELFSTPTVALNGSNDPCAGITVSPTDYGCIAQGLAAGRGTAPNPAGQYNGFIGGNQDLKPEKASTWTLGAVFRPSVVPRLNLSVDYFTIKIDDAIRSFGQDAILSDCVDKATADFTPASCDLVHRDAAGSLWLTPGGYVTDLPGNVGSVKTSGIEVNGGYSYPVGFADLSFSFTGTYLDEYVVNNGLTEAYDCAGLYGPVCSVGGTTDSGAPLPRWRHKARLSASTDSGFGLSLQWRYVGPVTAETQSEYTTLASENGFDPGLRIGSQSYFDLVGTYTLMEDFTFRLGVNNLFDKQPPYVTSGNGGVSGTNLCPTGPCNGNTYPATYDALGRYVYLSATLDF
ncbi:TonB-dependent receptor [Altererythrobacter sp. B11]|uniref:TonB-dependent receptor domain-containing protein n=1 Tax=Altererythrobacter sp. B11 TaxID=2060312 RepID=UPI000DC6ED12|nr:TonB-dependent receptor [Altererythrobacter sp. B11]BBC74245.1 TonB-dependent receptor [Altererythrobacter sp. B11]